MTEDRNRRTYQDQPGQQIKDLKILIIKPVWVTITCKKLTRSWSPATK